MERVDVVQKSTGDAESRCEDAGGKERDAAETKGAVGGLAR